MGGKRGRIEVVGCGQLIPTPVSIMPSASGIDISFVETGSHILSITTDFTTLGLLPNSQMTITGSTLNNGTFTVVAVTAHDIVTVEAIVDEIAGASVVITPISGLFPAPASSTDAVISGCEVTSVVDPIETAIRLIKTLTPSIIDKGTTQPPTAPPSCGTNIPQPTTVQPDAYELAFLDYHHAWLLVYDRNWDEDLYEEFFLWMMNNNVNDYLVNSGGYNINQYGVSQGDIYHFLDCTGSRAKIPDIIAAYPDVDIHYSTKYPGWLVPWGLNPATAYTYVPVLNLANVMDEKITFTWNVSGTSHYYLKIWVGTPSLFPFSYFCLKLTFPDARELTLGSSPSGFISDGQFNVWAQNAIAHGYTPNIADAYIPPGTWTLEITVGTGSKGTGGTVGIGPFLDDQDYA
jgi:hypothetical protein